MLRLGAEASRQFRNNASQLVDHHPRDDLAAFGVQVRPIDLSFLVPRTQIGPHIVADLLCVAEADGMEVDERHLFSLASARTAST